MCTDLEKTFSVNTLVTAAAALTGGNIIHWGEGNNEKDPGKCLGENGRVHPVLFISKTL